MPRLLDPLEVSSLKLKNRLVMPPMNTNLATMKGEVTEASVEHYLKRSRGPGLVIVEHAYVSLEGKYSLQQLGIYDDSLIPGLKKLVDAVHKNKTLIAIQINHAGGKAVSKVSGTQPVAPSNITPSGEAAKSLSVEEIEGIIRAFSRAAKRAKEAGFDAVEVHGAHGFLLNQFNSPLCNKRTDEYGGSIENRTCVSVQILKAIQKELGKGFPLMYRLGADDMKPGGITPEDGKAIARILVKSGVVIIDVSGGLCGIAPPELTGPGFFIPLANTVKQAVNVPVIGVGGITTASFADNVISEGKVDLVAVGRAILYNADWAYDAVKSLSG